MIGMTPWVLRLIVANVAVFLLTGGGRPSMLSQALAFYPPEVLYRPWTIVSYMFVHAGFGHLFGNMIGLYFFGPRLEERLGARAFLGLYFAAGIGGAIGQAIFAPGSSMVGASGGVYGVLVGFAMYWPYQRVFIFPIPVPIQAWILITGYICLSVVQGVGSLGAGVAHFAHLGGAAIAFAFIKWWEWRLGSSKRTFKKKMSTGPNKPGVVGDRMAVARWKGISIDSLHELNREEVERLLEKVGDGGAASLTASEREFLDRMAQRS